MKTLAYFSPLSPLRSGVAHYGDALARELAQFYKIIFYLDEGYTPTDVAGLGEMRLHSEYRAEEDMTLFQASNGPLHAYMYPYLLRGGAVMTLHDRTLYDLAMKYWEPRPRPHFWVDFILTEGISGVFRAIEPLPGGGGSVPKRIMHNLYTDEDRKRVRFPYMKRMVSGARGIVAHSGTVLDAAKSFGARCPTLVTPLAVSPAPPSLSKEEARRALSMEEMGVKSNTFVAIAYGFIQRHKRIDALLDAWKRFTARLPEARLILLGPRSPDYDIAGAIRDRNIEQYITIVDSYPPMDSVYRYLYSADLCVNLRYPVYGSSSYSLMQILSTGRPCVVTAEETFAEFRDDIVIKAPYGVGEVEAIEKIFIRAIEKPEGMVEMGRRAREHVESTCLWSHAGPRYHKFLEDVYAGRKT